MEDIKQNRVRLVHKDMDILGAMGTVNGKMENVSQNMVLLKLSYVLLAFVIIMILALLESIP